MQFIHHWKIHSTILLPSIQVNLHSFSQCWLPNLWNPERIRTYSTSKSSKDNNLGAYATYQYYYSLLVKDVSPTVFNILTFTSWKWLVFPTLPLLGVNPLEFWDETYPTKTRGLGLLYGENFIFVTSTVFDWSTRVSDGPTDGCTLTMMLVKNWPTHCLTRLHCVQNRDRNWLKVDCFWTHFQRKNCFMKFTTKKCLLAAFTHKATLLFWKANRFLN